MKEDYLWDKTGKDAEIENLENTLAVFRQSESKPPLLPLPETKRGVLFGWSLLRISIASAATVAVFILTFTAIFSLSDQSPDLVANNSTSVPETPKDNTDNMVAFEKEPTTQLDDSPPKLIKSVQKVEKHHIRRHRVNNNQWNIAKKRHRNSNRKKAIKTVNKPLPSDGKVAYADLSDEEKHAYNQLIKALAITSSNLRIVKDKVNGSDQSSAGKSLR